MPILLGFIDSVSRCSAFVPLFYHTLFSRKIYKMKAEKWKELIIEAKDNEDILNKLSLLLKESDTAKQELRNKGYGWTGLSLLETVKTIQMECDYNLPKHEDKECEPFNTSIKIKGKIESIEGNHVMITRISKNKYLNGVFSALYVDDKTISKLKVGDIFTTIIE